MRLCKVSYTDSDKKQRRSKRWYVELRDHRDVVRRIPAFEDKRASGEFARKLEQLVVTRIAGGTLDVVITRWLEGLPEKARSRLARIGLLDAEQVGAHKPLQAHLVDYKGFLVGKGNSGRHIRDTVQRIRVVLDKTNAVFPTALRASAVQAFLTQLTSCATSPATVNHYLQSIKSFSRWLVRERRMTSDPLRYMYKLKTETDIRRVRRALEPEELRRLLDTAYDGPVRYKMSGPERYWLYRLALETGLRANELRSLTRASFEPDNSEPNIVVEAAYSKRRRRDVQPLRRETAAELRSFLFGKLPRAAAFAMPEKTANMLRDDLADARSAWLNEAAKDERELKRREETSFLRFCDDAGRVVDFHALRHCFITNLARANVHPKRAQTLARHSTITLTMDHYTHTSRGELAEALNGLPDLSRQSAERQRATGTCDIAEKNLPVLLPSKGTFEGISVQRDAGKSEMPTGISTTRNTAQRSEKRGSSPKSSNAPPGTRTPDPLIKSQLLCQLS